MSDPRHVHEYIPRRKDGKCQVVVGGRSCHLPEDAPVHQRYVQPCADRHHKSITISEVHVWENGDTLIHYHCDDCGEHFKGRLDR